MKVYKHMFLFIILVLLQTKVLAENSAIVLMYHNFNDVKNISTNIKPSTFENQMTYLKKNNYNVLKLSLLHDFFTNGKKIPEKSVFITIDDGYRSVFNVAYPILKKHKFPFSVFISAKYISNNKNSDFMSWQMLKKLKKDGVEIYNHTYDHKSLNLMSNNEIIENIEKNHSILSNKVGVDLNFFSYPYGESNLQNEKLLKQLGFSLAFSQHSGIINMNSNKFRLPRFSLNEKYGAIDRFTMILKLLPLEVIKENIPGTTISKENDFYIFSTSFVSSQIQCFTGNGKIINKEIENGNIKIKIKDFKKGRNKINCTYKDEKDRLFWLSKLFYKI